MRSCSHPNRRSPRQRRSSSSPPSMTSNLKPKAKHGLPPVHMSPENPECRSSVWLLRDGSLMARRLAAGRLSLVQEPNTLSKSVDVCSCQVSAVCDLELRPGPVIRGRPRTAANETRTETGAVPSPMVFKSIRGSPPAVAATCHIGTQGWPSSWQDHPAYIPRSGLAHLAGQRVGEWEDLCGPEGVQLVVIGPWSAQWLLCAIAADISQSQLAVRWIINRPCAVDHREDTEQCTVGRQPHRLADECLITPGSPVYQSQIVTSTWWGWRPAGRSVPSVTAGSNTSRRTTVMNSSCVIAPACPIISGLSRPTAQLGLSSLPVAAETFRSVDSCTCIRTRSEQSVTSDASLLAVHASPDSLEGVRPGGSQRGSRGEQVHGPG